MRRGTVVTLVLALAACSGGDPSPRASREPPVTVTPSTLRPTTAAPTTAAPTTAAPTATPWPPPTIRVTTERDHLEFRTPSGNIACASGTEAVSCEIREHTWRLPPKSPACEYDWVAGAAVSFGNGYELGLCRSDTAMGARRVLAYGTGVRSGDFTCISEQAGVTCRIQDGIGFFISRNAVRELP